MKILTILTFLACLSSIALGQEKEATVLEVPECDIFLFDLVETDEGLKLSGGRNITNREGYDNQPWFTPDSSSLLYTANQKPDRTDLFEFFLDSAETKQVTDSETQEYSPQISPDNRTLSFVTDGATANQSIWKQDREEDEPSWLLSNQGEREPVGYYSWNHETGYILYWSRYGFSMRLVHETKELSHYVTGDAVPSSPYIIPGTNKFSFMHRQGNGETWIKELDPETLAVRPLTVVVGSNPNYGWTPNGKLIMCDGTNLNWLVPGSEQGWQVAVDLSEHGLSSATRVAVSPDAKHIAIVGLPVK